MKINPKIYLGIILSLMFPVLAFQDVQLGAKKYLYTSYLGCSNLETSMLAKKTFDSLIALPLCAKDSNQNLFPIQSFELTYAERGLYQDSAGLPIIFTDYSNVICEGGVVPKVWIELFNQRSYKGDTVFIDNVKVRGADNKSYAGKGMKIVIK